MRGPQTSPLPPLIIKRKSRRFSLLSCVFLFARTSQSAQNSTALDHSRKAASATSRTGHQSRHPVDNRREQPVGFSHRRSPSRQLPPEPAPPRTVIIERLPPLPPKPRDIIIERWLPYEIINQKRKVIVQRVQKSTKEQPKPKNIIITSVCLRWIKRRASSILPNSHPAGTSQFKPRSFDTSRSATSRAKIHKRTPLATVHSCTTRISSFSKLAPLAFSKIW